MAVEIPVLTQQLQAFCLSQYGPDASVPQVEAMPGHAVLSFGFSVMHEKDGQPAHESLVMRLPPKGVRQSGNTDVLRQAPLLRALKKNGVPVPEVRWAGDDLRWFEVPYLMVERLPGRTFHVWEPDVSFNRDAEAVALLYRQGVQALVQVHRLDWKTELAGWEAPRSLEQEIRFWDPILAKAAEPEWITWGEEVRTLLLTHQPADPPIGLFHGDYQGTNLLFDKKRKPVLPRPADAGQVSSLQPAGEQLVALLDWEISGISGHLLDLGWLLVFIDPESWDAERRPIPSIPPIDELVALYEEGMQRPVPDINWYRALAGYRFGAISCFNVMLHRRGKRHDPEWDLIAPSVKTLFGRAKELLLSR